jgi:hypothetical protein
LDDYGFFGHFGPHNLRQCRMLAGSLARSEAGTPTTCIR